MERPEKNTRENQKKDPRETCRTVLFIKESHRYKKRRTQANRLRGSRGWGRGAIDLREGESWRIGSKGAADELGENFSCSGVVPSGLEVQGLGKGPPGILTGRAAELSMHSCLDFLLAPWAEPRVWAVPIWMAQEVGGSQLHLKKTCGCVSRKVVDGWGFSGWREREVVSRLATDLRAQVGV